MILENNSDLKKYISISENFEFSDFQLYITKAINGYTKKYVGNLHVLLDAEATAENATIKNEAREHLRSAIANFGYFLFTPYNSVNMDGSGMSNISNDQRKNIEWWQLNDIRRELLRSGHESMDLLLAILESNPLVFTEWTTHFASINKELLIHNTAEFQKHYNIFDSRQTYLALVPAIRQVQDQYINTFFCPEIVEALKSATLSGNIKKVKEYSQKAIVAFTIAKVYDEGIFNLDASGIKLKFDTLPNESIKSADYGKPADQMTRAVKKQIDHGTNYLNLIKDIINANPSDFTMCSNPLLKKTPEKFTVYNSLGVVGL